MYAVIETGGKQYKVGLGDKLKVDKLAVKEGDSVTLDRVLMVADGDSITTGSASTGSPVTATVISHGKAAKIKVFKMKRRKNYRLTQGHRQDFTEIQIVGIGDEKVSAEKKPAEKSDVKETKKVAKKAAKKDQEKKVAVTDKPEKQAAKASGTKKKAASGDKPASKKKAAKKKPDEA